MLHITSESLKERVLYFSALKFLKAVEISCLVELSMKKVLQPGNPALDDCSDYKLLN